MNQSIADCGAKLLFGYIPVFPIRWIDRVIFERKEDSIQQEFERGSHPLLCFQGSTPCCVPVARKLCAINFAAGKPSHQCQLLANARIRGHITGALPSAFGKIELAIYSYHRKPF
ncbi:hypothetical protein QX204_21355 [Nocardia sp. PE-7]|uniref:hypothetical protein n=1 Tax=Nocardia sp. PE-7 TaxID=3058426 RepID=UPI00265ACF8E|nr:hypothetical protein [Nocardia sp. PE-7]WKG07637.1 hypothetical protein QX204_21355 [Nocardia sp. PE-7]